VAAVFLGPSGAARAQDAAGERPVQAQALGGYQGRAAASGFHLFYAPQGLLPIPSLADIGVPDALVTIASGPATFARASVADPGDVIANPGAVLSLLSPDIPAGVIPAYPFRVTANSSSGAPTASASPGPGLDARVAVEPTTASAEATFPGVNGSPLIHIGSSTATATTSTSDDQTTVTVRARNQLADVNILGLVTIDSLVTDLTATSDGETTEFTGGTTLVNANLAGTPITIDADGIHLGAPKPGDPLSGVVAMLSSALNEALKAAGINITLLGPVELAAGNEGQLSSAGLRVDLNLSSDNLPGLTDLINSLPPIENPIPGVPGIEDIFQVLKTHHVVALELGRAQVALAARPGFEADIPEFTPTTPTGSVASPTFGDGGFALPPSAPSSGRPVASSGDAPASEFPTGEGIAGLVALALLVQPFIGARIAAAARALLGLDEANDCLMGDLP
jgi:hypothetical protein